MSTGERVRDRAGRWALLLLPAAAAGAPDFRPAILLLHLFFLSFFWLLLAFYREETYRSWRELTFFAALFALALGPGAALARVTEPEVAVAALPVAALLITLLYGGRLAMTATAVLALVLATLDGTAHRAPLLYGLAGGVAGALVLRRVRRRAELYAAAAAIALALALAAGIEGFLAGAPPEGVGFAALLGAALALVQVSLVMLLLPVAEAATGRTTDFTLLELADPTQPLLARLSREAPGTWAHSLLVANLAEAGANAIGANGLLARVGGYYHDVGKLGAPALFMENFAGGESPHRSLEPRESARRVREHVTAGLDLARSAGLPAAVSRFIPEHHGTAPLEYFLAQVPEAERSHASEAPEFRYPGPRPTSRETAVVMLADAAEAAVRVLDERSRERVGEVLDRLFRHRVDTGQLSDAPLTLRDLARVREALLSLLAGLHHERADYPGSAGGVTRTFGRRPA